MLELKQCNTCRRVKAVTGFHRNRQSKDGLRGDCKECTAAYRAIHREEKAAYMRAYHAKHREEQNARNRAWTKRNPEKVAAKSRRRCALKQGATIGEIDYDAIWVRDGGRCAVCSLKADKTLKWPHPMSLSYDHTVPLSLGGSDTQENLRLCHLECNSRRGAGRLPVQMVMV